MAIDIRNGSNDDYQGFSLRASDLITGLEYVTEDNEINIHYGKGKNGKETKQVPFDVSYRSPETICFTRTANDLPKAIRTHDWLFLNRSLFTSGIYQNVKFNVYLHYPGQLLRSFHNPLLEANVFHCKNDCKT